ncbi:HEPACAM family member 2-like isoform X2 [Mycteria americana]|uniref:HEPACAM family member 2-like isoform X2 n=1 Tax=Mycteria americana TaxID=33587 RepID=UPI003F58250C
MISLQGCCTLCSILMFVRGNLGVLINIHQEVVNGIVGQSVLLPLSYRFSRAPRFPVSIVWMFTNDMDVVVSCTLLNCSLGAGGDPSNCSANRFPQPAYRGRAELFPENGSLLLRDLQLSDSGVYSVSFRPSYQTRRLVLTVHEQRSTPEHPGSELSGGGGTAIPCYVFGGCYCFILLVLQLLFHLRWRRPNSWEASDAVSPSVPGTKSRQGRLRRGAAPQSP